MSSAHPSPAPGTHEVRVVVVGAGFGGLGVARDLIRAGHTDVTVLERADDVGGVWRENTYPNAACDVPSPLYSWSWAPNPDWGRRYSVQPEILDYIRRTAAAEGLLEHVRTGVTVTGAAWEGGRWTVSTDGDTLEADLLVLATGQLSEPVVPQIEGADDFAGPAFHSARWRHDVDLRGRRVAVIGTGASAIQFVPGIVDDVGAMTVFQRTAPFVVPKPDREYSPAHHRLFHRVPATLRLERRFVFAISEHYNRALTRASRGGRLLIALLTLVWRLHLRRQVRERALRRRLRPPYRLGCKRLLFSNDWYRALDRHHVEVVADRVERIEADGVRTSDGRLHPADVLIWGTGFAATDFLRGLDVRGTDGVTLAQAWADGARAHLGMTVPGFPNLVVVYGPNTNLGGSSIIGMLEAQGAYLTELADGLRSGRVAAFEPRRRTYDAWDSEVQSRLSTTAWVGCESWYADQHAGGRITTNWPGLVQEYVERTAHVDWADLETIP